MKELYELGVKMLNWTGLCAFMSIISLMAADYAPAGYSVFFLFGSGMFFAYTIVCFSMYVLLWKETKRREALVRALDDVAQKMARRDN